MGGKIIKTVRSTTVIIGFIFLSLLFINPSVYGEGGKHEVTHGNDAGALKKCKAGGTCYTKRNGEYSGLAWFYYDFEANGVSDEKRDTFTFRDLLNNRRPGFPVDNSLMPGVNPNTRMSCKNSRGVYVFGYPLYQKTGNGYRSTSGIMFPQKYSELFNGGVYHSGRIPIDGLVSDDTAHMDYNGTSVGMPSAEYEAQWQTHDVSWFCSRQTIDPNPIEQKDESDKTKPPITAQTTCSQLSGNFGAYYKGNTSADTGVVNHSYSGTLGHNSWQKNFQGKNYVFAKPGDRVQFYETFCFPIQQVGIQTGSSHVSSADPPGESNFQIFAQKNGSEKINIYSVTLQSTMEIIILLVAVISAHLAAMASNRLTMVSLLILQPKTPPLNMVVKPITIVCMHQNSLSVIKSQALSITSTVVILPIRPAPPLRLVR